MGLILASASPRRRELLEMLGFSDFKVIPATCDEDSYNLPPELEVAETARAKAKDVLARCSDEDMILAADTLVFLDGEKLGKPTDEKDAERMLTRLSGRGHTVCTGVSILYSGREITKTEVTKVFFREISQSEILTYVETGEPLDKAGAYGAQGKGSVFIERIDGDFFNVMGLPLCLLSNMLGEFGVNILKGSLEK